MKIQESSNDFPSVAKQTFGWYSRSQELLLNHLQANNNDKRTLTTNNRFHDTALSGSPLALMPTGFRSGWLHQSKERTVKAS